MIWTVLAAALGAVAPADADVEKRLSAEYRRCAPLAQDDLSRFNCIKAELEKQNGAVQQAVEMRARKFSPGRKRAFVRQQYAWLAARNRQCLKATRSGPAPIFAEELKCRLFETVRHTIALERAR